MKNKASFSKVTNFLDKFVQMERNVCAYLLIVMVLITFIQVILRFIFRAPFSWAEEVTLMILVWFGYLCMPIDIYTDDHAALYFLYNKIPPVGKKILDIFRHVLLGWFFVEMIHYGFVLSKLNLRKIQAATGFSAMWLYLPLVVGGIFMAVFCLTNLIRTILKPIAQYKKEAEKKVTVEDIVKEKGGSV